MAKKQKTEIQRLVERLQPQYVGFLDQYRAIMLALGVDPDAPAGTCERRYKQLDSIPYGSRWEHD